VALLVYFLIKVLILCNKKINTFVNTLHIYKETKHQQHIKKVGLRFKVDNLLKTFTFEVER
jgi:hypothetical protein